MTLKLNGTSLEDYGIKVLYDTADPAAPETRDHTVEIPGVHGLHYFGADLGALRFDVSCAMIKRSAYEVQDGLRQFKRLILDSRGRPKLLDFVWDYEPDKVYKVYYSGKWDVERLAHIGKFTLPFISPYPFAESLVDAGEITVDSELTMDSDAVVDDTDAIEAINGAESIDVDNFGSMDARPVFEITGSFTTLAIEANGSVMVINNATNTAGAKLVIDNEKITAKLGTTNYLPYISGEFFELPPGVNTISFTGTGMNFTIAVKFRPRYL